MTYKTVLTSRGTIVIRSFRLEDETALKNVFRARILEAIGPQYTNNFHNLSFWIFSLATLGFSCVFQSLVSLLLTLAILVVLPYLLNLYEVHNYMSALLNGDLSDIKTYYIDKPRNHMWVAEFGGKVIGMGAVKEQILDRTRAELVSLCVAKDYRNLGIGSKLLETVVNYTTENGYTDLFLETGRWQLHAVEFYRRKGFQYQGEHCTWNMVLYKKVTCSFSIRLESVREK